MSLSRSVTISYYDPYGVAPKVVKDIESRLPLKSLYWHDPPRPLRSINSLSVLLKEETTNGESVLQHQIPGLLDTPYMKIILVKCDDNDTYRSSVRRTIREWFTTHVASRRDSTEWLIFYCAPNGSSSSSTLRLKTSVFDKIKADFNTTSKEDRCLLIRPNSTTAEEEDLWNEIMTKIKEGILDSFGKRVHMYEEEVKKLEAKKSIPGWNFATFFVMKEGLALSFEAVSLLEDALIQYDALDATFMQLMKENNVTFLKEVGFSTDSMVPLLSRKDDPAVRHNILENNISLFDFKCYLFSRQASLLLQLMSAAASPSMVAVRIAEFLFRARNFTLEISKMLLSYKKNSYLVANWVFGIVQEVMNVTESMPEVLQGGKTRDVAEGKAEIIMLARSSIERIAKMKGWSINDDIEEVNINDDDDQDNEINDQVMHPKLKEVIANEESYVSTYMSLTDAARNYFESADRTRSVDKLRVEMAKIKYRSEDYEGAAELLSSLPQIYNSQGWEAISTNLFLMYADCLYHLHRKEDYLKIYLQLLANRKSSSVASVQEICQRIQKASKIGETAKVTTATTTTTTTTTAMTATYPLDSLFTTKLADHVDLSDKQEDTLSITLFVNNEFRTKWKIDSILVRLIESSGIRQALIFKSSHASIIDHGTTKVVLTTRHNIPGLYAIDSIEFAMGNLLLVKDYADQRYSIGESNSRNDSNKSNTDEKVKNSINNHQLVLYQQPGNMDVQVHPSSKQYLADARKVIIEVHTGWNNVHSGQLIARSASSGFKLRLNDSIAEVQRQSKNEGHYGNRDNEQFDAYEITKSPEQAMKIRFGELGSQAILRLTVPYSAEPDAKELYVRVQIEFRVASSGGSGDDNKDDTDELFTLSVIRHCSLALSLAVNVQDVFKAEKLFSKFSVSCVGKNTAPLRVLSTKLIGQDEFDVKSSGSSNSAFVVLAKQSASYVFQITHKNDGSAKRHHGVDGDQNGKPTTPLMLHIRFRKLEDEMRHSITRHVRTTLAAYDMSKYGFLIDHHVQSLVSCDTSTYGFLDKIDLTKFDLEYWQRLIKNVPELDRPKILKALNNLFVEISKDAEQELEPLTKEMIIPVEIPIVELLFTLELWYNPPATSPGATTSSDNPATATKSFSDCVFYIGEAIPVTLELTLSRSWGSHGGRKDVQDGSSGQAEFVYEVFADPDTWIVSGKRKGNFLIDIEHDDDKKDAVVRVPLVLLPLKRGNLLLPPVEVRPALRQYERLTAEVDYKNNAESILVLPEVSNVVFSVSE
ncbi:trafficking protein particle complex subunit 10 [Lipomyces japonicus]|uniref:trafficking protein particle complex subunit 10 n=1 Tax=Lipomyces japonicus TaxID=56871 RepID=UPI0034CD83F1